MAKRKVQRRGGKKPTPPPAYGDVLMAVRAGRYDDGIGELLQEVSRRVQTVGAADNDRAQSEDEAAAKVARIELMKRAGAIVRGLGLTEPGSRRPLGVKRGNYADIIRDYGPAYDVWVREQHQEELRREREEKAKAKKKAPKRKGKTKKAGPKKKTTKPKRKEAAKTRRVKKRK